MRKVTHTEHQKDYDLGFDAKMAEILTMGIEAAKNKFNLENPTGQQPKSLGAYYYASGEMDAIVSKM